MMFYIDDRRKRFAGIAEMLIYRRRAEDRLTVAYNVGLYSLDISKTKCVTDAGEFEYHACIVFSSLAPEKLFALLRNTQARYQPMGTSRIRFPSDVAARSRSLLSGSRTRKKMDSSILVTLAHFIKSTVDMSFKRLITTS